MYLVDTNLTNMELIIPMKYLLSLGTNTYMVYKINSIRTKGDSHSGDLVAIYMSAEMTSDGTHWEHRNIVNLSQDLKYIEFVRDFKINQIQSTDCWESDKVEILRIESRLNKNRSKIITRKSLTDQKLKELKPGDSVWFKGEPGIISYRHRGSEIKYTVNVKDTYTKYVPYSKLSLRVVIDYSHIEIPEEIKKLKTGQLLSKRHNGYLPNVIKAELQTREHIKRKVKIKEYGKR